FSPEWESDAATHQLPRLTSLTLVSTGGCWAVASATHPTTSAAGLEDNTQPVATAFTLPAPGPSYEEQGRRADQQDHQPGQTPDQQDQAVLCPTLISNWHLLYVVGRQPMLSHLRLSDLWARGPGACWRTLPERSKLKARGVALLGRLPYLTSLQLQVQHALNTCSCVGSCAPCRGLCLPVPAHGPAAAGPGVLVQLLHTQPGRLHRAPAAAAAALLCDQAGYERRPHMREAR
ncbi:hypothetical protein HaLaN_20240, partial [Haematococcus lacustris]